MDIALVNQSYGAAFLAVVLLPTLLTFAAPFLIRRRFPYERLRANNEVAGHKYQAVGVVYAVLLGFVVVAVWERFHAAEEQVTTEATGWSTLGRLSVGLAPGDALRVREGAVAYLDLVLREEWAGMAEGRSSPAAAAALTALVRLYLDIEDTSPRAQAVVSKSLDIVTAISQSRRARLADLNGSIPEVLWLSLLAGSVIMIVFPFFLASPNLLAQAAMGAMVAFAVMSFLFVAMLLDRPFSGPASIQATPFEQALASIRGQIAADAPRR